MEVVASGITVVSLAIQLKDTVRSIRNFIQAVKDAPEEVMRLIEMLDLLHSLIDNAREVLNQQASFRDGPDPSATISKSLTACEQHIQPLRSLVDKYGETILGNGSKRKIFSCARMGLKAKDIISYEERISKAITILNAAILADTAISINSIRIQLAFHDSLSCSSSLPTPPSLRIWDAGKQSPRSFQPSTLELRPSHRHVSRFLKRRSVPVVTGRNWLGVQLQRQAYYMDADIRDSVSSSRDSKKRPVAEGFTFTWRWPGLGIGFGFDYQKPYGSILPSLTTYPIAHFGAPVFELVKTGTLSEVQQCFASGQFHPQTRTDTGLTLLHYAAKASRYDICELLIDLGLRSENATYRGLGNPLWFMMIDSGGGVGRADLTESQADTARLLLERANCIPEPPSGSDLGISGINRHGDGFNGRKWIFAQAQPYLTTDEQDQFFRDFLILALGFLGRACDLDAGEDSTQACVEFVVDAVSSYPRATLGFGSLELLERVFWAHSYEATSKVVGRRFLEALDRANIAIPPSLIEEWENACIYLNNGIWDLHNSERRRKVILNRHPELGLTLGWEWELDDSLPGYLVVEEYRYWNQEPQDLPGTNWRRYWPFNFRHFNEIEDDLRNSSYIDRTIARQNEHFNRRVRAKARKLRKAGKMPGSWIH